MRLNQRSKFDPITTYFLSLNFAPESFLSLPPSLPSYLRMMSDGSAEDSDFLSGILGMRPSANLNNNTLSVVVGD